MKVALAVMVKQPTPGRVKTRLCPPLTPEEAAELYRCFLLDKISQVKRIGVAALYLAFTPQEAEQFFRSLAGGSLSLVAQAGRDLGQRLDRLSTELLAAGHPAVLIIDSDTPDLPDRYLAEAVECLANGGIDAVFGPAEDGGYYLVGLRRPSPAIFQGITWSTPVVLKQTLEKTTEIGLRVHLLRAWFDVDTRADLDRLRSRLMAEGTLADHTRAFLERLAGGNHERNPA